MLVNSFFTGLRSRLLVLGLDRRAVTAIEYALIAALIAVVIITAVTNVGHGAENTFNKVAGEL